ncbi:MAG: hypothetical protein H6667_13785 [Ardenticatenaceae bacterium]|nr:hypothetical protein [Ardenticatenaceae bacterium]
MMGGEIPSCRSEVGQWKTVTHVQYGFSVDYPAIWHPQKYGDAGYRGDHDLKLIIDDSSWSDFAVFIYYRAFNEPTIENVVNWANSRLGRYDRAIEYEEIFLIEETVNGCSITKRRYKINGALHEEVYITRQDDMFIIELQLPSYTKEYAYDDYFNYFNPIVASFRPMQ